MKNQNPILTEALQNELAALQRKHHSNNPFTMYLGEATQTISVGSHLYNKVINDESAPEYIKDFFHDHFGYSKEAFSDTMARLTEMQGIISSVMMEISTRQGIKEKS